MYYDEMYTNSSKDVVVHDSVIRPTYLNPTETAYLRTYRSGHPRGGFCFFGMVPDYVADPWAWFLQSVKDQRVSSSRRGTRSFVADTGHAFQMEKHKASILERQIAYNVQSKTYGAKNLWLSPASNILPATSDFPAAGSQPRPRWANDLAAFGQNAIARSAPSKYAFNGAQFLGELREGLPRLAGMALIKGRVKDVLKNAGGEYLNWQFGWEPLVADVRNAATTLLQLDSLLKQKRSEQGKPHRAHWGTPPRMTSREWRPNGSSLIFGGNSSGRLALPTTSYQPMAVPGGVSFGVSSSADELYYLETLWTKRWFDGSFTSLFDYPDVPADWYTKAKALVQMDLTPEVLWELAPWSWLVDWVFKIQSSLRSNNVAIDKLIVMNYGYVMEKSIFRTMFKGRLLRYNSYGLTSPERFFLDTEDSYLTRMRANPFGFQASAPSALSVDQLKILAALGLSR